MRHHSRNSRQGRDVIASFAILLPVMMLLMAMPSCQQADCCSNFQGIRLCEFDTPDSYDSWEEYRTYLQSEGYACE